MIIIIGTLYRDITKQNINAINTHIKMNNNMNNNNNGYAYDDDENIPLPIPAKMDCLLGGGGGTGAISDWHEHTNRIGGGGGTGANSDGGGIGSYMTDYMDIDENDRELQILLYNTILRENKTAQTQIAPPPPTTTTTTKQSTKTKPTPKTKQPKIKQTKQPPPTPTKPPTPPPQVALVCSRQSLISPVPPTIIIPSVQPMLSSPSSSSSSLLTTTPPLPPITAPIRHKIQCVAQYDHSLEPICGDILIALDNYDNNGDGNNNDHCYDFLRSIRWKPAELSILQLVFPLYK